MLTEWKANILVIALSTPELGYKSNFHVDRQ